ncbi:MAG: PorT family protein [Muribaculaceae bacterium]|nr:PorT family protein [Muribaculaceae bacterium]
MVRNCIIKAAAAISIALCSVVGATAQTWGVRTSMDVTFPSGGTKLYDTGAGLSIGGVASFDLPRNFYVEPSLYFSYTGFSSKGLAEFDDQSYLDGTARLYSLRVPVYVGWHHDISPLMQLGIATGPYVNVNLSARQGLQANFDAAVPLPDKTVDLFKHGWKRVDAGWGISLSMTFAQAYYVGLSTGVSFTPLASYGNRDKKVRIHRHVLAVSLGYNF